MKDKILIINYFFVYYVNKLTKINTGRGQLAERYS